MLPKSLKICVIKKSIFQVIDKVKDGVLCLAMNYPQLNQTVENIQIYIHGVESDVIDKYKSFSTEVVDFGQKVVESYKHVKEFYNQMKNELKNIAADACKEINQILEEINWISQVANEIIQKIDQTGQQIVIEVLKFSKNVNEKIYDVLIFYALLFANIFS